MSINKLEFHPLANVLPLLEGEDFVSFVADVRVKGVVNSIYLYEGKILDGRNRYRAALEADVQYSQRIYDGDDPIGFVISQNLERRMLTLEQKAFAGAKLANLASGQTVKFTTIPGAHATAGAPSSVAIDQTTAAKIVGSSPASIARARAILDSDKKDGTEIEKAVLKGDVSLSHAADEIRVSKGQKPHSSAMGKRARAIANGKEVPPILPRGNSAHVRDYLIKLSQIERMCTSMLEVRIPVLGDETDGAVKTLKIARQSLAKLINNLNAKFINNLNEGVTLHGSENH